MSLSKVSKSGSFFSSRLGFIATASGAAIGLGNIWRFPYLAAQYGGASFVLLYLLCIAILGYPIMLAKLTFGRANRGGTFSAYQKLKGRLSGLPGIISTISALMVLAFYPVVMGFIVGYMFHFGSFSMLPADKPYGPFFESFTMDFYRQLAFTLSAWGSTMVIISFGIQKGIERFSKLVMPLLFGIMGLLFIYGVFFLKNSFNLIL